LEAGVGDRNFVYEKSIFDQNITLIRDLKDGRASRIMLKEESLAQTIIDKLEGI
jgi:hypothetical protein